MGILPEVLEPEIFIYLEWVEQKLIQILKIRVEKACFLEGISKHAFILFEIFMSEKNIYFSINTSL